jgi:hypothetical protein
MNKYEKHDQIATKHATHGPALPFGFDVAQIMDTTNGLAAMTEFNGKLFAGLVDLNKECVRFIHQRLREDLNLPQKLAACKSPKDLFAAYTDFYRAASHDYQHEFARILKMGQSLAAEATQIVQAPHRPSK